MSFRTILISLIATFHVAGIATSVSAQQPPESKPDPKAAESKPAEKQEPKKDEPKKEDKKTDKDPKTLEYEKAIKDLKKVEGPFTFFQRKKDLLLELPESKLDQIFLIQATMGTGVSSILLQAGDPIGAQEVDAFKFERHEDQVWLIRPNFRFRWNKDDMLNVAADRSLPNAILGGYRIEQSDPEKKLLLVNVTPMFFGELFQLSEALGFVLGGQYGLDRDKSGVDSIKGFSDNSVVRTKLHYFSPRGGDGNSMLEALGFGGDQLEDPRSVPMSVTYNLWFRKESGYRPRLADPRVGYFSTDFYSLDRFLNDDRTERYIQRFDLRKKDPSAALSEPIKPIVWTLDPSIPEKYRGAVTEGILRWNKAFEGLGFKDAVRVQEVPKEDKDFDHADGRYNVIRWTMSPDAGYAVALFRVDPFTGEMLNASVTVDANMLAYIVSDFQNSTVGIQGAQAKALQAVLRDESRKEPEDFFLWASPREQAFRKLDQSLTKFGWLRARCEAQYGLADSAAFGWSAMQGGALKVNREDYVKAFIADVVSHEVGHCLGLRHNFAGSTHLTTEQLADDSLTNKENVSASVMDYTPVNVQAVLKGKGNFFATTIGVYDKWAIQYGYTPFNALSPVGEKHELARIAAKSGLPGHAYMTDENADGWDPFVVRFDNASDPLTYSAKALEAARRLRNYAITKLPKPGESYDKRTRLVLSSISRTFREGRYSARFIGGVKSSRSFRGDAGAKPTLMPVDTSLQRQAMSLVVKHCFTPEAFTLPANVLNTLSFDPALSNMASWNAPLRDLISGQQMSMYATLMSAGTTDRIAENAYKSGSAKNAYSMDEHFSLLMGAVFREVGTAKQIEPTRRDLQRFALTALMVQAGAPPGALSDDARTVASDTLTRLGKRLGTAAKAPNLDGMTRVHLRDCAASIQRFEQRQIATAR